MKTVFHIHTNYSKDASLTIEKLAKIIPQQKIDCLIVCDHNTILGAQKLAQSLPCKIIMGEEIAAKEGEIIGLFLKKEIPKNLSIEETIAEIKKQNGLVCLPHPFDRLRKKALKKEIIEKYIDRIDIIEIFNGRTMFVRDNQKAKEFALQNHKLGIVGADAHLSCEIGLTFFEIANFNSPGDFLDKLKKAQFYTRRASVLVHFITFLTKAKKRLKEKFQKF